MYTAAAQLYRLAVEEKSVLSVGRDSTNTEICDISIGYSIIVNDRRFQCINIRIFGVPKMSIAELERKRYRGLSVSFYIYSSL